MARAKKETKTVEKKESNNTVTNKMFAMNDEGFRTACERENVTITSRQAFKWRRGRGVTYKRAILHLEV
jgi:hypothetical protein